MQIPKIDISEIEEKEFSRTLLQDFFSAYNKYGFGYIINHGIEKTLIEQLFQVSKQFHSQPLSEKMRVALDHNHRGYIAINTSTDVNSKLADVKKPNQSESFMMMREDKSELPDVYLSGPNQWPKLENFKEVLEKYTFNMTKLGRNLMRLALLSSGVKDLSVMQSLDTPTIWLRLLHYPPISKNSPSDLYGSAPHTDFGCLTILAQDEIGGLQVQTREGKWIDVPKLEGSFVVNVGDMLSRYTNGYYAQRLIALLIKVVRNAFPAHFFRPHTNAVVQPLKGTGKPKFSPSILASFYVKN